MKKVLILAYDFPPNNSIGSQRPYSWYQHFINNQLYPVIITRHWDSNIISEIDCIFEHRSKLIGEFAPQLKHVFFEIHHRYFELRYPFVCRPSPK